LKLNALDACVVVSAIDDRTTNSTMPAAADGGMAQTNDDALVNSAGVEMFPKEHSMSASMENPWPLMTMLPPPWTMVARGAIS
jgi:hypothetical protein